MSSGRFLGGLVLGGMLGAVLALLTTPKSGPEARSWLANELGNHTDGLGDELKKHAKDLRGCVTDMTDKAKDKANVSMDEFRDRVQKVAGNIEDSARSFIEKAKSSCGSNGHHESHHPSIVVSEDSPN